MGKRRIEILAHRTLNGVDRVYHITLKDGVIIHRTFIPSSRWPSGAGNFT